MLRSRAGRLVGEVNFLLHLPKTRSGKIVCRVSKTNVLHHNPRDISTIGDAGSVKRARIDWQQLWSQVARGDSYGGSNSQLGLARASIAWARRDG
jgi:hypothetical protein